LGLCPRPAGGAHSDPPDALAGLRVLLLRGEGRKGRGRVEGGGNKENGGR